MRITFQIAVILLAIALIAVPAVAGDWPVAKKDARHTSYADSALSPPLELEWSADAGGSIVSSPVVADGVLYFSNDAGATLVAVNLSTYTAQFRQSAASSIESTPAVTGDAVIFGSYDGNVYSLSKPDGSLRWKTSLNSGIFSSPLVYQGHVYIGTDQGAFYALREDNGNVAWTLPGNATQGSPAGADGKVFIGMLDGNVYALDPGTGAVIWAFDTADSVHSSPMVYDGMVYIASRSGKLYALDENTGRPAWTVDLGYKTDATPAVDPATGAVFIGTFGGYVHAVNASTGDARWVSQFYGPIYATAAVAGDTVYGCTQDGRLFALDVTDGSGRWSYDLGGETWASPAIADGRLVIGTMSGQLLVFRASSVASQGINSTPTAMPPASTAAATPFPGIPLALAALASAGAIIRLRR
jgi:outer membrane protein assembly factor BamB